MQYSFVCASGGARSMQPWVACCATAQSQSAALTGIVCSAPGPLTMHRHPAGECALPPGGSADEHAGIATSQTVEQGVVTVGGDGPTGNGDRLSAV